MTSSSSIPIPTKSWTSFAADRGSAVSLKGEPPQDEAPSLVVRSCDASHSDAGAQPPRRDDAKVSPEAPDRLPSPIRSFHVSAFPPIYRSVRKAYPPPAKVCDPILSWLSLGSWLPPLAPPGGSGLQRVTGSRAQKRGHLCAAHSARAKPARTVPGFPQRPPRSSIRETTLAV